MEAASPVVAACVRFLTLTACRSSEARLADWSEIDLTAGEWRIEGARMKNGKPFRVPLSSAALGVLESVRHLSGGEGLIFPSPRSGKALSDMALTQAVRRAGLSAKMTVHGQRSAFRTWRLAG